MVGKKVVSGASVFVVRDVVRSAEYYRDALGFRFSEFWGEPPVFCMVWRDEQCVMLSQVADETLIRPVSSVAEDLWDAYLWVNDANAFFGELRDAGACVKYEPRETYYGVREFAVIDPDGYVIAFGEELPDT